MMRKALTIFTPTYNRAYILPQLYSSLTRQTNTDFEWLVVNDGSVDDTEEIVKSWIDEGIVEIRYIKQDNGGKMKAHNTGVQNTDAELFFCVDSDDYIVDTAVDTILNRWNSLGASEKKDLAGMVGYRGSMPSKSSGNEFPIGVARDTLQGFYKKGFSGETSLIFRVSVIKEYKFPIIGNEKFITEAYVYDQIDQKYQLYAIPEVLTIFEYRADGLTQNVLKTLFCNPCGYVAFNIQRGNFAKTTKACFMHYMRATAFARFTQNVEMPICPTRTFLYGISYPFGWLFYLYKRRVYAMSQRRK